jgi:hypothetical protein
LGHDKSQPSNKPITTPDYPDPTEIPRTIRQLNFAPGELSAQAARYYVVLHTLAENVPGNIELPASCAFSKS